jgi:uncharacterized membrane protein/protein-disulfide isomerase
MTKLKKASFAHTTSLLDNIFSISFSSLGLIVSLYSLISYVQVKLKGPLDLVCDINDVFNCSKAIESTYSDFLGIPLGAIGMSFFIAILTLSILDILHRNSTTYIIKIKLIFSTAAFIACVFLAYSSIVKVKVLCPTCLIAYVFVSLILVSEILVFFVKRKKVEMGIVDRKKILFSTFILSCPPLIVGVLVSIGLSFFKPYIQETTSLEPVKKSSSSQSFGFNTSPYVGNGEDFRKGFDKAPVVIQIFSDFGCIHCKNATDIIEETQRIVGHEKLLFVYRFFPLTSECNPMISVKGYYPYSCLLALGSRCAGEQGAFWPFKTWGFEGLTLSNEQKAKRYSREGINEFVSTLHLDETRFFTCLDEKAELKKIEEDARLAKERYDIEGTPLILINGEVYKGGLSVPLLVDKVHALTKTK